MKKVAYNTVECIEMTTTRDISTDLFTVKDAFFARTKFSRINLQNKVHTKFQL